jgi:hypothetical protein
LSNVGTGNPNGACLSEGNKICTFEAPQSCSGVYFGDSNTFTNSNMCGGFCTQGYTQPASAGLPALLCATNATNANAVAAAPCDASTCLNVPIELNTCLKNDLYSYNCNNLCEAYNTLQPYDYNTVCKKQAAPPKPVFCT